ncbi:VOC family protein [Lysinibacter sp. HNR]|uniref:VOC family protein n=1 Tax=Lysinibacter sp. HNR TaxID=3031408 RepID=UPI0024351C7B|nr:VOC family protein [Lysinibacter sp. HNR]WGD38557.1 VOC family protein [Lysinibacter sp. HNR]
MAISLNPYIGFRDNAREAMEFYQSVFGGDLSLNTFGDLQASEDPAEANKIMHAMLTTHSGLILMGADTPSSMPYNPGDNYSISLSGPFEDDHDLTTYYEKLSEGATILQPLATAPWGDKFGMLTDKFGVTWLVNIAAR